MKSTPAIHHRRQRAIGRRAVSRRQAQAGVGIRIRAMRETRGWSQNDLARRCRINLDILGQIERGNFNFHMDKLLRIARGLDTTVAELLLGIA